MIRRIVVLILSAIMMMSIACFAVSENSDLDHQLIYEMELQSVKVDLTNQLYLRDAIGNLQKIGAYKFAKSYVQYLQAILDMMGDSPDLIKAQRRIKTCSDVAGFSEELAEQGFPSCEILLVYVNARILEEEGRLDEAYDNLKTIGDVLDAVDRLFALNDMIANAALMLETEDNTTPSPVTGSTNTTRKSVIIDAVHFPDNNFREYVRRFDLDSDGRLSQEELDSVKIINVNDMIISNLEGIKYFSNLSELWCGNNSLEDLDVSYNTALTWLYCDNNELTSLDVSKNTMLTNLYCQSNMLTSLDVSKNTKLSKLSCSDNKLTVTAQNGYVQYSYLPGIDRSRIDYVWGAQLEKSGFLIENDIVSYRYDLGNGHAVLFTLLVDNTH